MSEGLPAPSNTGANGTQRPGSPDEPGFEAAAPLEGVLLNTVRGLARSNPRSLGGDTNAAFLAGIVHHLTNDLESVKIKLNAKELKIFELSGDLAEARTNVTKLTERLSSASKTSRINQWTGIIGTALLGIALDMYKSNMQLSYAVAILGGSILLLPIAATHIGNKG